MDVNKIKDFNSYIRYDTNFIIDEDEPINQNPARRDSLKKILNGSQSSPTGSR